MKLSAFRLRALDTELAEILQEADGRCATAFALRLDDIRVKLSPSLMALDVSQSRIVRKHADKDGRGNPKPDDKGTLKFSTPDQQEQLNADMAALSTSELDVADDLPKIRKSELAANGLATSGQRVVNLRPLLDTSLDEPGTPDDTRGDHHVMLPARGRVPDA